MNIFLINFIFKFLNIFDYLKLDKLKIRLENLLFGAFVLVEL